MKFCNVHNELNFIYIKYQSRLENNFNEYNDQLYPKSTEEIKIKMKMDITNNPYLIFSEIFTGFVEFLRWRRGVMETIY